MTDPLFYPRRWAQQAFALYLLANFDRGEEPTPAQITELSRVGYRVVPVANGDRFMGYKAFPVLPANEIRGWYASEDEAWHGAWRDYQARLEARQRDG